MTRPTLAQLFQRDADARHSEVEQLEVPYVGWTAALVCRWNEDAPIAEDES
jgi:hypothetical protein